MQDLSCPMTGGRERRRPPPQRRLAHGDLGRRGGDLGGGRALGAAFDAGLVPSIVEEFSPCHLLDTSAVATR
jgi:hypothetical protein